MKIVPDVTSKSAESLSAYILRDNFILRWIFLPRHLVVGRSAHVLDDELEILTVGDQVVFVNVDVVEDLFCSGGFKLHLEETIGTVDQVIELRQVHFALSAMRHVSSLVGFLQTHLSTMPLKEEVSLSEEVCTISVNEITPLPSMSSLKMFFMT